LRLAVFTVALLFIVALAVLTVQDIRLHGATPVDVLAIVVLLVFTTGIVGAFLHPPRR
jgi:heme A synthase